MKILFSDFDGTLVDNNESISAKNIERIQKLRAAGHIMVICTGRNLQEFQRDEKRYHFPFDYLVLNNGGQIVDSHYQTLYEKTIDYQVGVDILNHTTSYQGMWSYFCDGHINYAYKDGVTINHGIEEQPFIDVDFQKAYQSVQSFQIICFNQDDQGIDQSQECFEYIQEHYGDDVEAYFNTYYVDVVPKGCSKGTGMKTLLSLIDDKFDKVYAIGDSYNDLSMIEAADDGYTFVYAHNDIKEKTKKHVRYVYEVIDDMLGGDEYELAR